MYLIINESNDPYYNQALEEIIFSEYEEDIILLWRNKEAVICGRYQNMFAEVDTYLAKEKNIAQVRRVSGGGTVYHDMGNINYSIMTKTEPSTVDYEQFLHPVIDILKSLGVSAEIVAGNGIGVKGKKISGSAQRMVKDRVLHHGTILFDTNLEALKALANGAKPHFSGKSTASNPWPVVNLKEYLPQFKNTEEFLKALAKAFQKGFNAKKLDLNEDILKKAEELNKERYIHWDWNFAQCPPFSYKNEYKDFSLEYEAKKAKITKIVTEPRILELEEALTDTLLKEEELEKGLKNLPEYQFLAYKLF